jgi:hypothetical protein
MSARARGDHDSPYMHPWRPKRPGTGPLRRADQHSEAGAAGDAVPCRPDWSAVAGRRPKSRVARRAGVAILVLVMAGAAYASERPARSHTHLYPSTPRAWLDAYLSTAVDNPSWVCRVLFAPELAARYRHTRPGSCTAFFFTVEDSGVRIRRIVQSDGAAVIELRQAHPPRYAWNVVLARQGGSWQAVDLVGGQ